MQKMNKREKKFEKKLDMKLEKLENKTKKIIEKKQHTLWGYKKLSKAIPPVVSTSEDASSYNNTASAVATAPTEFIMDATPLEEYNFVPHVVRGELVSQVWQVINNGQMPWTNEVISYFFSGFVGCNYCIVIDGTAFCLGFQILGTLNNCCEMPAITAGRDG